MKGATAPQHAEERVAGKTRNRRSCLVRNEKRSLMEGLGASAVVSTAVVATDGVDSSGERGSL